MKSSALPTDHHGWSEFLPKRKASAPLTQSQDADWVIVGAGVTGLACARRLADLHPHQDILLVEGREIGQGATARSSGFAVDSSRFGGPVSGLDLDDCQRVNFINRTGLSILRDAVSHHKIDCDWREEGFFHGAADHAALAEVPHYADYLAHCKLDHHVLEQDEIAERTGTHHYKKAVFVQDGALLQPAKLVRGLAETLPQNVRLFEKCPILSIEKGEPNILHLAEASIRSPNILLCTNYDVAGLGFHKNQITGITLSGSFTRPLNEEELSTLGHDESWGLMSLYDSGATLRLTVDQRLCIRNVAEFRSNQLLSDTTLQNRVTRHRLGFEARFPHLAHIPFEYSWSGVEGISRNGTNFFGALNKGLWFAGGYNGSGISRGTAFGTALADMASGHSSDLVTACLQSKKAAWMPPEPLRSWGGNLILMGHDKKAGRDG